MKVIQERRNELTGTTIRVNDFRGDPEWGNPEHPWSTACKEHQEGAEWRTRADAMKFAASPPDWCGGCEHEWNERQNRIDEEDEIAQKRTRATMLKAKVTVSLKLACGCSYRGTEPISVFEATHPGVSRVCPKHETSQVVTEVRTKLYERTS